MTYDAVMAEYELLKEDILAALDYAAKLVAEEEIQATGRHAFSSRAIRRRFSEGA